VEPSLLRSASLALRQRVVSIGHNAASMGSLQSFTPHRTESQARARGCFTCRHFHGIFYAEHMLCERNGGRQVIGTPRMGCAFWELEPRSDDA